MSELEATLNAAPEAAQEQAACEAMAPEAVQTAAQDTTTDEVTEATTFPRPQTKAEILARLEALVAAETLPDRAETDYLRVTFYRIINAEAAAAREAFDKAEAEAALKAAEEGTVAVHHEYKPAANPDEETFKAGMNTLKERRAQQAAALEAEKQENLTRKLAIIDRIKLMIEDAEGVEKFYDEFKTLQAEWKEIQLVPAERATELWKNYQLYVEKFYDLLRLEFEFRAYDFKKNLEVKTRLCEKAEALAEMEDPIAASRQLQPLHDEWRETGPVAKELREELWLRFKAASTIVNKRHQDHFLAIKEKEEANLAAKTTLCEKAEALDTTALNTNAQWEEMTAQVLEMQNNWKQIGYTPRKVNAQIFERFRTACDKFFQAKAEHFRNLRETFSANLEKKTALCEKAEALKDSTEWAATTDALIELQKQWKAVGPVAHKLSDALWHRFNEACNHFFNQKQEANADKRNEEEANLEKKNGIIARLETLAAEGAEDLLAAVRALQAEWNEVGHVPFRKKEKMYRRYREICDKIYETIHSDKSRRRVEGYRRAVAEKAGDALTRERQKMQKLVEDKKAEIQNYETNLTFLNAKSKSGNSLVAEIERRIERLKSELEELKQKMAVSLEQKNETESAE